MRGAQFIIQFIGGQAGACPPRPTRRPLAAFLLRSVPLLLILGTAVAAADSDTVNQAALVVAHGDGRVLTRCVAFEEPQISGLDLLQRAGLDLNLEASGIGATVCRLDGEGCTFPAQSCFCQCDGATCTYWSYWRRTDGAWRYSQQGASASTVLSGAVEAWVWGEGTVERATPPPDISFADVCMPATATPTITPTSTATQTPAPATIIATATPTPSPTDTPTPAFTAPFAATAVLATPATATPTPSPSPSPTVTPLPIPITDASTAPQPVIELFAADRKEIVAGETFILSWRVANAKAVELRASGRARSAPAEGSFLLAPPQNTTYELIATGTERSVATSITVIVRPRTPVQNKPLPTLPVVQPADQFPDAPTPDTVRPSPASTGGEQANLIVPIPVPTDTPSATLAPVELAGTQPSLETTIPSPTTDEAALTSEATLPLLVVGLVALAGMPLLMVATLFVLWLSRRPS